MTTINFAQLSDIHISSLGNHHDLLSGQAPEILAGVVAELNQINDLDFVLITGDLFDTANQWEFDQFQQIIRKLEKPCYILPGNHDRRGANAAEGLTRHDFARHFNPQYADRPAAPEAQAGYWSIEINPKVQLIGLDSIRDEDWGGIIDDAQLAWLPAELARHTGKLVIVGVHHPLHLLHPIDNDPAWTNFVCDNGPEMLTLLDEYPQVKLVLTGHHHLPRFDTVGPRLHLAHPSLVIYPCGFRTFRLTHQPDGHWRLQWQWHTSVDEPTLEKAHNLLIHTLNNMDIDAYFAEHWASTAFGKEIDRAGEIVLTND